MDASASNMATVARVLREHSAASRAFGACVALGVIVFVVILVLPLTVYPSPVPQARMLPFLLPAVGGLLIFVMWGFLRFRPRALRLEEEVDRFVYDHGFGRFPLPEPSVGEAFGSARCVAIDRERIELHPRIPKAVAMGIRISCAALGIGGLLLAAVGFLAAVVSFLKGRPPGDLLLFAASSAAVAPFVLGARVTLGTRLSVVRGAGAVRIEVERRTFLGRRIGVAEERSDWRAVFRSASGRDGFASVVIGPRDPQPRGVGPTVVCWALGTPRAKLDLQRLSVALDARLRTGEG